MKRLLATLLCILLLFVTGCSRKLKVPPITEVINQQIDSKQFLAGYYATQLIDDWGAPTAEYDKILEWQVDDKTLVVSYNTKDIITSYGVRNNEGVFIIIHGIRNNLTKGADE